jgi:putative transposase
MQRMVADRTAMPEVPRAQRRPLASPLADYRDTIADKKAAMAAAYATGDDTMHEITSYFGVDYTTVSRAVRHAEQGGDA